MDNYDIDTPPEPLELIPIGEYDGGDLLPATVVLDDSYIVYLEVENPECECEAIVPDADKSWLKWRMKQPKTIAGLGSGIAGKPE